MSVIAMMVEKRELHPGIAAALYIGWSARAIAGIMIFAMRLKNGLDQAFPLTILVGACCDGNDQAERIGKAFSRRPKKSRTAVMKDHDEIGDEMSQKRNNSKRR